MAGPAKQPAALIQSRHSGIAIHSTSELIELATIAYKAGAPKGINKPEQLAVAIAFGLEIGLKPMQAIASIKIVNGRPSIYGEAGLALLRNSSLLESIKTGVDGEGESRYGWIKTKRRGDTEERTTTFSVKDAKTAGLWGNTGPWTTYPDRMLKWRAVGFHTKDEWADVLCGLTIVALEEADQISSEQQPAAGLPTQAPVEVIGVQTNAPTPALNAPSQPQALPTAFPITDEQKNKFAIYRSDFLKTRGVDVADKSAVQAAWVAFLGKWNVDSALKLNTVQADEVLAIIYEATHTAEQKAAFSKGQS